MENLENYGYTNERIRPDAIVFAIYCAMAPLNMVMNFTGTTINKYVGIVAAMCMMATILFGNKFFVSRSVMIAVSAFWLWSLSTIFWSIEISSSITQFITLTSLIAVFVVGAMRGFNSKELSLIKHLIIITSSLLIIWLKPSRNISFFRGTLETSAGVADHNGLAANILFGLWIAIDYFIISKGKKKIMYLIPVGIMGFELMLILSRGAIVAFLVSFLVYFFICKRKEIKFFQVLVILLMGILLFSYFVQTNPELAERLTVDEAIEDGGGGRIEIWTGTIRLLDSNLLRSIFGYGFGCEAAVSNLAIGRRAGTHNVFLEFFATTGLIGLVLYVGILALIIRMATKRGDHLAIALIVSIITISLFLGFSRDKGSWNMLLLSYIGFISEKTYDYEDSVDEYEHPDEGYADYEIFFSDEN